MRSIFYFYFFFFFFFFLVLACSSHWAFVAEGLKYCESINGFNFRVFPKLWNTRCLHGLIFLVLLAISRRHKIWVLQFTLSRIIGIYVVKFHTVTSLMSNVIERISNILQQHGVCLFVYVFVSGLKK
jgi:hypothetical protein